MQSAAEDLDTKIDLTLDFIDFCVGRLEHEGKSNSHQGRHVVLSNDSLMIRLELYPYQTVGKNRGSNSYGESDDYRNLLVDQIRLATGDVPVQFTSFTLPLRSQSYRRPNPPVLEAEQVELLRDVISRGNVRPYQDYIDLVLRPQKTSIGTVEGGSTSV